jgi:hypothetical protein
MRWSKFSDGKSFLPSTFSMAAVNTPPDDVALQNNWAPQEDQTMGSVGNGQPANGAPLPGDDINQGHQDQENNNQEYPPRGSSVDASVNGGSKAEGYRGEKQVKVLSSPLLHSAP